ncbi:protein Churchill-like [Pollicipes pollicipes]|uniref:protein Churchill-like n=1 Tax=Pollicipes pollicipes TaxID=41117 RepID=UPI001884D74C|nr:protein Churchill-like [Pollicipes pollicipes]
MCHKCLKTECPQRDRIVLESGTFMLNLRCCSECGVRDIKNTEKHEEEDEEGTEIVTFSHTCSACRHLIAVHRHTFSVEEGYQEYAMECSLCGSGQDSHSVLPDDPRHSLQTELL